MVKVFHNPAFLEDCFSGKIANIDFAITQNIDGIIWGRDEMIIPKVPEEIRRSTSWGDMLVTDGKKFFVDGIGFKEIL